MENNKLHGLCWFPNIADKFATWGQKISLYEVLKDDCSLQQTNRQSTVPGQLLTQDLRYLYARTVAPSYHTEQPILAVGLNDGKVGICNFMEHFDSSWEYTPRQLRPCTCVTWSEADRNLVAIGHDRHRSDSCITIWDISGGSPKDSTNSYAQNESVQSLCWVHNERMLVAGMSQKFIKMFDLRQETTVITIPAKAVHGLSVAPNGNYLCSYIDSIIMLYDVRHIERSLSQIHSSRNHLQISWCTTRSSLLCSLQRDAPHMTLYDVRSADGDACHEVYHIKRQLSPFPSTYKTPARGSGLNALSWHHHDFERALILADSSNVLEFTLPVTLHAEFGNRRRLPVVVQRPLRAACASASTEASNSNICDSVSSNHSTAKSIDFNSLDCGIKLELIDTDLPDLVEITRRRVAFKHGSAPDNDPVISLPYDSYLYSVRKTLSKSFKDGRFEGLKTVLGIASANHATEPLTSMLRVETQVMQWPDFINNSKNLICYRNEQRDKCLQLCGWPSEQEPFENFAQELCSHGEYSRAAMIAVFHMKILLASNVLSSAAENESDPSMYRITAIALCSFNADLCSSTLRFQPPDAKMQIKDPHLRTIFAFLTIENDNFDTILEEEEISIGDRVAIACKYLNPSKLAEFMRQQIQNTVDRGDLNGLLLTGESIDGISILQAYVDATSDIQTAAMIAIDFFRRECFMDKRIQYWINSYLELLNNWGLWEDRAELEIKIEQRRPVQRQPHGVHLACNFCGKSISNVLHDEMRQRTASGNINKLSSCPSCRKPLPRCSLCLLHMGTMLTTKGEIRAGKAKGEQDPENGWQPNPFSKWFCWCQTCRHGGHTEHIMDWFKENSECPVSSCSCRCFDLDRTN